MAHNTGRKFLRGLIVLILSAASVPAMAGLIYTWQDDVDPSVTGFIEFADSFVLGDVVDPYTDGSIVDFGFMAAGVEVGFDDVWSFFFTDIELNEFGLCSPSCDAHGGVRKTKKKYSRETGDSFSYVEFEPTWREGYRWDYYVDGLVIAEGEDEPVRVYFDGTGTWALGSAVPVPEPGALGLFLCGLGLIGVMRRRLKARE